MKLSKLIPRQVNVPYVGALYDLTGKVVFVMNGVSFLILTRSGYYDLGDSLIRDIFSSYASFMLACLVGFGAFLMFVYVFVIPNLNSFTQKQAIIDNRSPAYDKTCEIGECVKRIEERMKVIEDKLN